MNKCVYCNGLSKIHWPKPQLFRRCIECGIIFREPFPTEKELRKLYDYSWKDAMANSSETGGADAILAKQYAREIGSMNSVNGIRGKRILDYGAGRGFLLEALQNCGANAYGYEPYGYEAIRQRGLSCFNEIDEIIDKPKFDGVVSMDVFEHLHDPWKKFTQVRSLIRKGGWLIISTPNPSCLNARLNRQNWREARKQAHVLFATTSVLCRILTDIGFSRAAPVVWKTGEHLSYPRRQFHRYLDILGLYGATRVIAFNDEQKG